MRAVPEPFDVVVTTNSGYPLDQNLYQAVKGMSAAAQIVKTGGVIVCAAECRDGLPSHGSYGEVLASQPNPGALLDMIRTPGPSDPSRSVAGAGAGAGAAEGGRAREDVGAHARPGAGGTLHPRSTMSRAQYARCWRRAGAGATLCVLPQGPQTIPYVDSRA
jgi:hypothetical protein